ncbi:MFS transporter [Sphingobium sufflavum]|uniref:MFS transporter n=1 Tax=Sphingobium sufflavum TaxID=1129547 RepID=UPI001F2F9072|nr:MFS transporter [Sphingobium sufflavum]MCE7798899.1 MFS transporter [Sphingobium sufflavum]
MSDPDASGANVSVTRLTAMRIAILGTGVLPAIAAGTVSVMLPSINDAFNNGSNGIWIKSVATAAGLGMMVGAPASGFAIDRLGRRRVLLTAAAVFGAVGCSITLMTQLWQIIIARFFIGIASGAMGVGIAAVIGDMFRGRHQGRWLGLNAGVATFFVLVLSPVVGAMSDLGWRYGFAVYALAIPVLLAVAKGIPNAAPRWGTAAPRAQIFTSPRSIPWRAIILAVFMGTLSMGTALYWPFRLREVGIETGRDIALYGLPNILLSGAAALGYGVFRRYMSITSMFVVGACLSAMGLIAMGLASKPAMVGLGLMVEGLAIGMMTPNLTAFALSVGIPAQRGQTVGLVKGALYGSPFLTQFILEPVSRYGGASAALWTIAAMAIAIALAISLGALGSAARGEDAADL